MYKRQTFDLYMNNMRAMMQEQVFASDVVIFNRTDDDTEDVYKRQVLRRTGFILPSTVRMMRHLISGLRK